MVEGQGRHQALVPARVGRNNRVLQECQLTSLAMYGIVVSEKGDAKRKTDGPRGYREIVKSPT